MGSGNCAYWAGDVFDVGDDQVAIVVGDPDAHEPQVVLAVEHCPTRALSLERPG
jgi:ferredoxin